MAFGATPVWLPATMPATWVPWPLQSFVPSAVAELAPSTKSIPGSSRPARSGCGATPESMTYTSTAPLLTGEASVMSMRSSPHVEVGRRVVMARSVMVTGTSGLSMYRFGM
jgi:hypothetical protein